MCLSAAAPAFGWTFNDNYEHPMVTPDKENTETLQRLIRWPSLHSQFNNSFVYLTNYGKPVKLVNAGTETNPKYKTVYIAHDEEKTSYPFNQVLHNLKHFSYFDETSSRLQFEKTNNPPTVVSDKPKQSTNIPMSSVTEETAPITKLIDQASRDYVNNVIEECFVSIDPMETFKKHANTLMNERKLDTLSALVDSYKEQDFSRFVAIPVMLFLRIDRTSTLGETLEAVEIAIANSVDVDTVSNPVARFDLGYKVFKTENEMMDFADSV